MKKFLLSFTLFAGVLSLSACGGPSQEGNFPLPDNTKNVSEQSVGSESGAVNYQVEMSLGEIYSFYKESFGELTERELLTIQNDTVLNLVFDGHDSGKAIVIQATPLNDKTTNVNIRFEEI